VYGGNPHIGKQREIAFRARAPTLLSLAPPTREGHRPGWGQDPRHEGEAPGRSRRSYERATHPCSSYDRVDHAIHVGAPNSGGREHLGVGSRRSITTNETRPVHDRERDETDRARRSRRSNPRLGCRFCSTTQAPRPRASTGMDVGIDRLVLAVGPWDRPRRSPAGVDVPRGGGETRPLGPISRLVVDPVDPETPGAVAVAVPWPPRNHGPTEHDAVGRVARGDPAVEK